MTLPIDIELARSSAQFEPGEVVSGRIHIQPHAAVGRVEVALVFYTEGKGDSNEGVGAYQHSVELDEDTRTARFALTLPLAPCSYEGELLQIHWVVRVNVLAGTGYSAHAVELPFAVGRVRSPELWR